MSARSDLIREGYMAYNFRRDPDLAFEISHAIFYVDQFNGWQMLDQLHACTHGLVHCPICQDEQQWPSRANRGDLIP